jgi:ketosteroid isomerase-like protein
MRALERRRIVRGMTESTNIQTVQRLYEAYGRGDVDGVLAELADDVDWAAEAAGTGVPWWGSYHGKAEVPRFFKEIGTNLDITEFAMIGFTSNDTDVVATVHWTFTVPATGRSASMYMQHWFRLDGGKIVFFRGSEDSAQSLAAFA